MNLADGEGAVALRESVQRMIEREFPLDRVAAWDEKDSISKEEAHQISKLFGDMGFYGLCIPEEFGGAGRQIRALTIVQTELAKRSMALQVLMQMGALWGGLNIVESGTELQKRKYLPGIASGEFIFSFAVTEPGVGADLANVTTRAERHGRRVVINGQKRFITGAAVADYMYTLVRSGKPEDRRKNLSFVIIPTNAPGITITPIKVMGTRGIPTNEVFLENVEIDFDDVIGGEEGWNNGWSIVAGSALEVEKLTPVTASIGIAEAVLEEAWEYSQQRVQGGKRICGHQAVRHILSQAQTDLQACRLMLSHAASMVESNADSALATSMAKLFITEKARDIVIACQQHVMGAYGYAEGFITERRLRDVLIVPMAGGSTAIQRNNIANLMKLPRE